MAVSEDEIVDIRVRLDVLFGKEHKMFLVLSHVVGFIHFLMFDVAVLCPSQSKTDSPAGVDVGESPLTETIVEDGPNEFERLVRIAHAVTMCEEKLMAIYLCCLGLLVEDNAALFCQVLVSPDVMVACEVMYLNSHVCQFRQLTKKTRKPFGHHILVLIPEVKHVAQQVNGCSLFLDAVKKAYQPAFLHTLMWNGQRSKVGIGKEIYVLHTISNNR